TADAGLERIVSRVGTIARDREREASRRPPGDRGAPGLNEAERQRCRQIIRSYDGVLDFTGLETVLYFISRGSSSSSPHSSVHHRGADSLMLGNAPTTPSVPVGGTGNDRIHEMINHTEFFPSVNPAMEQRMFEASQEVIQVMALQSEFTGTRRVEADITIPNEVLLALAEAYRGVYQHQAMPTMTCQLSGRAERICSDVQDHARTYEDVPEHRSRLPSDRPGLEVAEVDRLARFLRTYSSYSDSLSHLMHPLYMLARGAHSRPLSDRVQFRFDLSGYRPGIEWTLSRRAGERINDSLREMIADTSRFPNTDEAMRERIYAAAQDVLQTLELDDEYSRVLPRFTEQVLPHEAIIAMIEAYLGIYQAQPSAEPAPPTTPPATPPAEEECQEECTERHPRRDATPEPDAPCVEPEFESSGSEVDELISRFDRDARMVEVGSGHRREYPDDCAGLSTEEITRARHLLEQYEGHLACFYNMMPIGEWLIVGDTGVPSDSRVRHHASDVVFGDRPQTGFVLYPGDAPLELVNDSIEQYFPDLAPETKENMRSAALEVMRAIDQEADYHRERTEESRYIIHPDVFLAIVEACEGIYPPQVRAAEEAAARAEEPEPAPRGRERRRQRTGRYRLSFGPAIGAGILAIYNHEYPEEERFEMHTGEEDIPGSFLLGGALRLETPRNWAVYFGFLSDYGQWNRSQAADRYAQDCGDATYYHADDVEGFTVLRNCEQLRDHTTRHRTMTLFEIGGEHMFQIERYFGLSVGLSLLAGYADSSMVEESIDEVSIATDTSSGFGDWLTGEDCQERMDLYSSEAYCARGVNRDISEWSGRTNLVGGALSLGFTAGEYFHLRIAGGFLVAVDGLYIGRAEPFFGLTTMVRLPVSQEIELPPRRQSEGSSASLDSHIASAVSYTPE
ncbi:hypothetical protein KY362_00425, partial [Candidatus Woesearchaeota archaeon]|nr:hypothetical protein [Candidatus Woesearchaeota archaeon]